MDRRALIVLLVVGAASRAGADAYVRVLTQSAEVRSGPGAEFRELHRAARGDVFPVRERGTRGYWFLVAMDDGTQGWIYGEEVAPYEVVDDASPGFFTRVWRGLESALLGPPPAPSSDIELSFSAGVIGGEGLFLFRPALLLDPYFAIELFIGESPAASEQVLLAGGGWTLRLLPGAAIGPYLHASAGVGHRVPKADAFTLVEKSQMVVDVGGGFEITFKKRITLRLDYRHWVFFDPNDATSAEEYTGGLAIFF